MSQGQYSGSVQVMGSLVSTLVPDPWNRGAFCYFGWCPLPHLCLLPLLTSGNQLLEGVGSLDSTFWWYLGSDGLGINHVLYTLECLSLPGEGDGRAR